MINNDVLRSLRFMLDLADATLIGIARLPDPGFELAREDLAAYLKREGEDGFQECPDAVLAHVLDGLVIHYRGVNPDLPARPVDKRLTNNLVLKKLRVAFELKDVDMHQAFEDAGHPVSKPELSAFFRQPGHKNYRACGDQLLRNFLKGLTMRSRGV
ncbi:MAG TPA: DUF1456 family protein [Arenimonas sp.]|uniref:DUF1456 family protein n=1 Tax=Arenimonas sp. TaxID=1872635 RepID=UPI002D7E6476|nr:DUF1456 family protein [Arenimonas sp.]HEU0152142.1 DUF1456 family protein [Arenimonas sp.]